jgi:flagellar biosynthesis/type III secretory pathway protein FliH
MLATAPAAFAATPPPALNAPVALRAAQPAPAALIRPADYESGYRDGHQDGYRDGKEACGNHTMHKQGKNTERGYADGYQAGFSLAQYQCNGDG